MINKEVIIFQIEDMLSNINKENFLLNGGYISNGATFLELMTNVLTLLKEQEPKMVIESENMYTGLPITHCPKCGKSLDRYLYGRRQEGEINFCPYCGQAVKWNDESESSWNENNQA